MDLSRISVEAKLRGPWEAIDLGFVMARRWWRPLFLAWLLPPLTLFLLLSTVFYQYPLVAYLLVWWLKPLWDRLPLYIGSRALFSESVTTKEVIRAIPGLFKKDLLAWLSWRRFCLTRSFDMPVTVLENLSGDQRSRRMSILHRKSANAATWLTLACLHLEAVLTFGSMAFVYALIPEQVEIDYFGIFLDAENSDITIQLVSNTFSFMAISLVAPFYTMAGFALYINRRIELEGWDIEIRFRHLAQRTRGQRQMGIKNLLIPVVFISMCFLTTADSVADENNDEVLSQKQSKEFIQEVLSGEDFHKIVVKKGWRLKSRDKETDETLPEWVIQVVEFIERFSDEWHSFNKLVRGGAKGLEFILWITVISLFIYTLYYYREGLRKLLASTQSDTQKVKQAPAELFGLDVRRESLPQQIPEQVMSLWHQGEPRKALNLLYRATLSRLINEHKYHFHDGNTEQECADIIAASAAAELTSFVNEITRLWQAVAYGHRAIPQQQLELLCQRWPEVFFHAK